MIFQFAVRNIFRNKKRSLISAISVFTGAMLVGLAYGWVNGMIDMMVNNYIRYQTGHVRITTEEYIHREKFLPVDELLKAPQSLIDEIKNVEGVKSIERRIRFGILMTRDNTPMQVIGVGLEIDNNSFDLRNKVVAGSLDNAGFFIGKELAEKLGKKLGDELLVASETSQGGFNGIKLPIAAIIETKIAGYDERFLFMPLGEAERLLKMRKAVPEIFIFADSTEQTGVIKNKIQLMLEDGQIAQTFQEQMGGLYGSIQGVKLIYLFIEIAILFLASIVIINTMIMAIFERMREIGTMKALGFSEKQLFKMFTAEGALIGIAGGVPGTILGWLFVYGLSIHGVDLGDQLAGMSYPIEYIIRPYVKPTDLIAVISMALLVPTLAAMIPGKYIKKYLPADALRM